MIVGFKDIGSLDIFNGINSKEARRKRLHSLWSTAARKLDLLDSVMTLQELFIPPGNHLEALSGDRKGQYSIRINQQYRICFAWTDSGPDLVEISDYH